MYDPKVARFLQEDTYRGDSKDPLSLNLYTYCVNNPLMYSDPTGHTPVFDQRNGKMVMHKLPGYEEPEQNIAANIVSKYFVGPLLPSKVGGDQDKAFFGQAMLGNGIKNSLAKEAQEVVEEVLFKELMEETEERLAKRATKQVAKKAATKITLGAILGPVIGVFSSALDLLILTGDTYHNPDNSKNNTSLPPGFIEVNGRAWSSDTGYTSHDEAWEIHSKKPVPIFEWGGWPIKSVSFNETDTEGYQSSYQERYSRTPISKGYWTGERAESKFISNNSEVNEVLKSYELDGIEYKDAIPYFSKLSWGGDVKIKNMKGGKSGRDYNFSEAYKQLSGETGISVKELKLIAKDFKLTWHECNDMETMQLIPTVVNDTFGHLGGVGEINSLNRKAETK